MRKLLWLSILAFCALGCSNLKPVSLRNPCQPMVNYAQDLVPYSVDWQREIARRYPEFYMVSGHGVEHDGRWMLLIEEFHVFIDVQDYADALHSVMPDTRIVFVVCNPGGVEITTPNVTYATTNVWVIPDKFISILGNWERDKPVNYIGNIFEFKEN